MRVVAFTDDYDVLAGLSDSDAGELQERDEQRTLPWHRWLTADGTAALDAFLRPDSKWFLRHRGAPTGLGDLVKAAQATIGGPLWVTVDEDDAAPWMDLGFSISVRNENFEVAFSDVLPRFGRRWIPSSCDLIDAAAADPDRLFHLDNALRGSVPGVEGWSGDRALFEDELTDPASYKVARCDDAYVGLARMWNNPSGPSFGLVGVVESHRGTTIAGALIAEVVTEAATWGSDSFTTSTSVENLAVHPHLSRVGRSLGISLQMVLD